MKQMYVCVRVCMCLYVSEHVRVHMCMRVCTCVCVRNETVYNTLDMHFALLPTLSLPGKDTLPHNNDHCVCAALC